MASDKRLIILTRDGQEHRYVANRLCQSAEVEAVIVDHRQRKRSLRRATKSGLGTLASKAALLAYRRVTADEHRRHRATEHVLGSELTRSFLYPDRLVHVDGINSDQCIAEIQRRQPDALLVYGTSIVADRVLALAADVALNMHTGISPYYRGTHCAFWPIVNGEPHMIGATVHECTSAIDGGRLFATAQARLCEDDGLHECFARAVQAGAEIYTRSVGDYLLGKLQGRPQDLSAGTEYRGTMRGFVEELKAQRQIRAGLIRNYLAQQTVSTPARAGATAST